jgi:His-Xaa-Ser system protein HxsD
VTSPETVDFEFTRDERSVAFVLDEALHPLDAIYEASYLFIDRCHVFLRAVDGARVEVRLRSRRPLDGAALEALARAFAGELLDQEVRLRLADSTAALREYYVSRALFVDPPGPSIDAILAELDAEDPGDDPLDIRLPWDEKRKKEGSA